MRTHKEDHASMKWAAKILDQNLKSSIVPSGVV